MKCTARSIGYFGDSVFKCKLNENHSGKHQTGGTISISFVKDEVDALLKKYNYLNSLRPLE